MLQNISLSYDHIAKDVLKSLYSLHFSNLNSSKHTNLIVVFGNYFINNKLIITIHSCAHNMVFSIIIICKGISFSNSGAYARTSSIVKGNFVLVKGCVGCPLVPNSQNKLNHLSYHYLLHVVTMKKVNILW